MPKCYWRSADNSRIVVVLIALNLVVDTCTSSLYYVKKKLRPQKTATL